MENKNAANVRTAVSQTTTNDKRPYVDRQTVWEAAGCTTQHPYQRILIKYKFTLHMHLHNLPRKRFLKISVFSPFPSQSFIGVHSCFAKFFQSLFAIKMHCFLRIKYLQRIMAEKKRKKKFFKFTKGAMLWQFSIRINSKHHFKCILLDYFCFDQLAPHSR